MKTVPGKPFSRRSPIRRQLMILLSLLSLASVALGFVMVMVDDIAAYEGYEARLGSYLARLTADFSVAPLLFDDRDGALERLAYLETIPGLNSVTLTKEDDTEFARWEKLPARPGEPGAAPLWWLEGNQTFHAAVVHKGVRIGDIVLEASYEAFRETVGTHFVRMMWILLIVLVTALVFAYALQRPISTPIRKLAAATESVALGKRVPLPIPGHSAREIAELYESFNFMLKRIDEREQERDAVQSELRQAHDELEARVVERTLELEGTNAELLSEVRERAAAEKRLTRALNEREVLLREIHHRVKNNLNVVYGLLALQARELSDAAASSALAESQQRVKVMATVHETLYESVSVSHIRADEFAARIVSDVQEVYAIDPARIRINTSLDCFILDLEQAIPVGLILNELLTNAFKHAFPGSREGAVRVGVSLRDDASIELCVADNGVGMGRMPHDGEPATLGLRLVGALSRQLDGHVEFAGSQGTEVRVIFAHRFG